MLPLTLMMFAPMAEANAEDAKLAAAFNTFLDAEFRNNPAFASAMGKRDYDDQLDKLDPARRSLELARREVAERDLVKAVDAAKLSAAGKIDLEIFRHSLALSRWLATNDNRFEFDPRIYGEYHTDTVFSLFTQSTLPRERNVANAARRITYVPEVLEAAKLSLKNPPKILTEIAITRTKGSIEFYEKGIYELAKEDPATSQLREPCRKAAAALKEFVTWLEKDLLPRSTGDWRLGQAKFSKKLELELNAGLTAEEVLQEAESEAVRVEAEMLAIAKKLYAGYFPNQQPPSNARQLIAAVLGKIGEDCSTEQTILADAKGDVAGIKEFIRAKQILTLPEPDRCKIIEMPEFQRGFSAAYLNNAPPLDPTADSLYAISPPPADWPKERQNAFFREYNRRMLKVLTIHEAYPGHYVQLEYANRNPSLIRKVFASGVYIEGWAVYTEKMMLDAGYGQGDNALRLQQLKFYLRAVLNAILDHKMHCANMTDEAALKMLMEQGFQTEAEAVGKVARAKQSSCQLSTYFVGRTAFHRLRTSLEKSQGEKFNLKAFHEAALNEGSVPVKYLKDLVK